jgi:hypothetical protein
LDVAEGAGGNGEAAIRFSSRNKDSNGGFSLEELPYAGPCLSPMNERLLNMNNPVLSDTLIGEEWMALRQITLGAKAAAIPRSVRTRLEVLDLISRDDYGQLVLTETGRRLIARIQ